MGPLKAFGSFALSAAVVLLCSCSSTPAPEEPRPTADPVQDVPEEGIIPVRELDAEGRIRVRRLHAEDLIRELDVRVFVLGQIQPPTIDPNNPGTGKVEDWELYAVIEALLTRDIHGKKLGRLEFDPQTACFIARDTVLVLDRIGDLLSVLDPSDRLRMWLEAREAEETGRRHLKRERGHLRLGRVPELLRNAHEALLSVPPGDEQRGALRQPLLNLRNEIDRIQGNPSVPREKKQSPYY